MSDIITRFYDTPEDGLIIKRTQDVEGILDQNKREQSEQQDSKAMMRKVASIPNVVVEQWLKEGIDLFKMSKCPETRRKILQKLNSNEYRDLRTHNSRL